MAVTSNSPSKPTLPSNKKPQSDSIKRNPSPLRCSSSSKRVKCAKNQIFDEGINDPESKRTCHQCRQKSTFVIASCKNQKNGKLCPLGFCSKCLLNRYGEKVEEVDLLSDWKCPKCRDVCNCSRCMKNKGKNPTGMLAHTAKATGYPSVLEMLTGKKAGTLGSQNAGSSPVKLASTRKVCVVSSPSENGIKKNLAGKIVPYLKTVPLSSVGKENVGDCKRKNIAKDSVEVEGIACVGKDKSCEEKVLKKLKGLKERNPNICDNEGLKKEKKNQNVISEMKNSKISEVVKEKSSDPNKEEVKKGKNSKKTKSLFVISKDISQECIKKDEIIREDINSQLDDKKEKPYGGTNDKVQALPDPIDQTNKIEVAKKEKSDEGAPRQSKSSKVSSIVKENELISKKKERDETNHPLSEGTAFEEVFRGCVPEEGKAVEGCRSPPVDEKSQAMLNLRPAVCENAMKILDCADIPLPQGNDVTNVAGMDLPSEDIGPALQFLEFCSAFGQFFHLMKGQSESILRDLMRGPARRSRSQYSPVVQFHIQLLSLLLRDSGEKSVSLSPTTGGNSWLQALGKCISDSECPLNSLPSSCFNKDGTGYSLLDSSKKLRLLNFLCDEALCTADLRTWIDNQNSKILEKEKEAREKVLIAKDKEKRVKQKMQDELQKATINENPLSISERDDLISKMRAEAENAHSEVLEAMKKIPQRKQRSDVLRTEPVLFDGNGHVFWKLKSYSGQSDILVQDIGHLDSDSAEEKWFTYEVEQKGSVENYISMRGKRVRLQKSPSPWTLSTSGAEKVET